MTNQPAVSPHRPRGTATLSRLVTLIIPVGALGIATLGTACFDDDWDDWDDWTERFPAGERTSTQPDAALTDLSSPTQCIPQPAASAQQRCSDSDSDADSGLPRCGQWVKVEPEGAQCSDGSPYKFFVSYSNTSDNLLVMFEPGGACFDYDSCTRSKLGAVNPEGIADTHMQHYEQRLNLLRRTQDNPAQDWNFVFVSYCTGDVHGGDRVATYPDPAGGSPLTYRHVGARNTRSVIDFLVAQFEDVPQLLVTGCSAGGTGATQHYALIREAMTGAQCGYLLDDSGPIFSSAGPSAPLHMASRQLWNLDPLLGELEQTLQIQPGVLAQDFGRLNTALAQRFPRDRFALAAYQRDLNYSLYSYAVFTPGISLEQIQASWETDLVSLRELYETEPNLGYYMPYFRSDNCSHCATIPPLGRDELTIQNEPWLGSEIAGDGLNLHDYIRQLLDDRAPLGRHFETDRDEEFTPEQAMMCLPTG